MTIPEKYLWINALLFIQGCFISNLTAQGDHIPEHPTRFSFQISEDLEKGRISDSRAAYQYTYIGEYEKAMKTYDYPLEWGLDDMTQEDSLWFTGFQPVDAMSYLAEKTKDEQLVIISEAHHKPQHRIFTADLLDELYENGFRYLGLEALTPDIEKYTRPLLDTALQSRGYPLNSPITGIYTQEPQMGNLIRRAIDLGFKLFAYEAATADFDRDLQQAINVQRFMAAHPGGKVVLHCGWYHAVETDLPKRKDDHYMAFHVKNLTGIDPLTIYQDALTEHLASGNSPYFDLVKADEPSILINEKGKVFNGEPGNQHVDIFIYHPPTIYKLGRPHWIQDEEHYQWLGFDAGSFDDMEFPVLIKAFPEGEKHSVPVDIIEFASKDDISNDSGFPSKVIYYPKNVNTEILIVDKQGKTNTILHQVD